MLQNVYIFENINKQFSRKKLNVMSEQKSDLRS